MKKNIKVIFVKINQLSNFSRPSKRRILRFIAKQVLISELNSLGIQEMDIISNHNGKKMIRNNSIFFSISYSEISFVIAFSNNNIGIDIEQNRTINITNLVNFYNLSLKLRILNSDNPVSEFLRFWTFTESYCKFHGISLLEFYDSSLNNIEEISEGWNCDIIDGKYIYHRVIDNYFMSICAQTICEIDLCKLQVD